MDIVIVRGSGLRQLYLASADRPSIDLEIRDKA